MSRRSAVSGGQRWRCLASAMVLSLALFAGLTLTGSQHASGENGTPTAPPGGAGQPARQLLLQAVVRETPPAPLLLRRRRLTLAPAAEIATGSGSGVAFLVVGEGVADLVVDGPAVLLPETGEADSVSAPVPVATGAPLVAGDQVAFSAGTAWTLRNPSAAPSVSPARRDSA